MVTAEEALKFMEDRVKRKKKTKFTFVSTAFPLLSLSRQGEKRKDPKTDPIPTKGSQRQRKESRIAEGAEAISIQFPPNRSIRSDPKAFTQVFPQLVFENDLTDFKKLGEISIAECDA